MYTCYDYYYVTHHPWKPPPRLRLSVPELRRRRSVHHPLWVVVVYKFVVLNAVYMCYMC